MRLSLSAIAGILLLGSVGCTGSGVTAPQHLSGIFIEDEDDLQGTGRARLVFTFNEGEGKIQGGIKIITEDPRTDRHIRYSPVHIKRVSKAHHVATRTSDGVITGTADLGDEIGVATFTGRVTEQGFEYSMTDKLGTVTGVAEYYSAYNAPGLFEKYKNKVFTGSIETSQAFGVFPIWNWTSQTVRIRCSNVRTDGMGGVEFDVVDEGSVSEEPKRIPGALGLGDGDDCGGLVLSWVQGVFDPITAAVFDLSSSTQPGMSRSGVFAAKTGMLNGDGEFTGTAGESTATLTPAP